MMAEEKKDRHDLWITTDGEEGYPNLDEGSQVWVLIDYSEVALISVLSLTESCTIHRFKKAPEKPFHNGLMKYIKPYPSEKLCLEALVKYEELRLNNITSNMQDSINTYKARILQLSCIALIFLLSQSCVTRKACESKFGQCGFISPVHIEMHDTTVVTEERVRVDTFSVVRNYRTTDTVLVNRLFRTIPRVHSSNNVQMFWLNDSTLAVRSVCKSDTVRIKGATKTVTQLKETVKEVEVIPKWVWFVIGGFALFLVVLFAVRR